MKKPFLPLFFILMAGYGFAQIGTLDTTFGMAGKIIVDVGALSPLGRSTSLLELALQPDGKLLAVGYTYGSWEMTFCYCDTCRTAARTVALASMAG